MLSKHMINEYLISAYNCRFFYFVFKSKILTVTVSLCLLFYIPGKYFTLFPLYLNSLNETV
nr:MAG TPA: hypothetical protein [Caudoviricetes sp.]